MLMPSIFGENLFDDFFGDFPFYYDDRAMKDTEKKLYGRRASHIMKTDIKETDKGYELVVDLPGFTKDAHRKNHGHIVFDDLFCKIGEIPNGTIIRHRGKQGQQDG